MSSSDLSFRKREVKRAISSTEKETIPVLGPAMVLPAEPGTEIEELVEVGFDINKIYAVENDVERYRALELHYRNTGAHLIRDDVLVYMATFEHELVYNHLDLCCEFREDVSISIQSWIDAMAPTSRLRVTVTEPKRTHTTKKFHRNFHDQIAFPMCNVGYLKDERDKDRWERFDSTFRKGCSDGNRFVDTTRTIAMIMFLNLSCGVSDWRTYAAHLMEYGRTFTPPIAGRSRITNVARLRYKEQSSPNWMQTIYVDLEPLPDRRENQDQQVILDELGDLMDQLSPNIRTPYNGSA